MKLNYLRIKSWPDKFKSYHYILLIIALASVMVLPNMGQHDLSEWDESRNGMNAWEMLHNGDIINLYYDGKPDTWNVKPPFVIWMIAISYKLFGLNEFALRFPSFLGIIFFFVYFFKLVRLFGNNIKAFACCLFMLSCQALLGWHVGLNGDFDAMLVFALTASAYYFIRYVEFGNQNSVYLLALFTGLAFYIKGTAGFVFIPGFMLYILFRGKTWELAKNYRTWLSVLLFFLIMGSWLFLVFRYGITSDDSFYGSKNTIETLFLDDTYNRLSNPDFGNDKNAKADHLYFFKTLEERLDLWRYLFYLGLATGAYLLYRNRKNLRNFMNRPTAKLIVFALCMLLPLSLVLTFSTHTNTWYLAPVLPFAAIISVTGAIYWANKWRPLYLAVIVLFVFMLNRQLEYISSLPEEMHNTFNKENEIFSKHTKVVTNLPRQDILLYLKFVEAEVIQTAEVYDPAHRGKLLLIRLDNQPEFPKHLRSKKCHEAFCLME